jgi:hypothetical protein
MGDYSDRGHLGPWTTRTLYNKDRTHLGPRTTRTVDTSARELLGPRTTWRQNFEERYRSSIDFYVNVLRVEARPFVMSNSGAQTLIPLFQDVQRLLSTQVINTPCIPIASLSELGLFAFFIGREMYIKLFLHLYIFV